MKLDDQVWINWEQVHNLAAALEERTRTSEQRDVLMLSDDRLADLETKAAGMAQAIHEIRFIRRHAHG